VEKFLRWCEDRDIALKTVEPIHVAAYLRQLRPRLADLCVSQHLASAVA